MEEGGGFHSFDQRALPAFLQWPSILRSEFLLTTLSHSAFVSPPDEPFSTTSSNPSPTPQPGTSIPHRPQPSRPTPADQQQLMDQFWKLNSPFWVITDASRQTLAERDYYTDFNSNYITYELGSLLDHEPSCSAVLFSAPDVAHQWQEVCVRT